MKNTIIALLIILFILTFTLGVLVAMKITLDKIMIDIRKIKKWIDKARESQNER